MIEATAAEYDDQDEDENEDDDLVEPERIPTAVLGPAVFLAIIAAAATALGAYALTDAASRTIGYIALPLGLILAATVVGLFRRSRVAHTAAYVIGGIIAVAGLPTIVIGALGVAIVWGMSTRQAKDWFGIR